MEKAQIEDEKELEFIYDETVRKAWDAKQEECYFSVVDVCQVLTEQSSARTASTYWAVLKKRLIEEGADQLLTTTELSRNMNPHGYDETEKVTVSGGNVAANARKELEGLLGRSIISSLNATSPIQLDDTKKE